MAKHVALARVIVICPTPLGGHIEHAADLCEGFTKHSDVRHVTLITRPGAACYLDHTKEFAFDIAEILPPTRDVSSFRHRRAVITSLKVIDWLREYWKICGFVNRQPSPRILIFELARYPYINHLVRRPPEWSVLVLHNVRPHFDPTGVALRERFLLALQRKCFQSMDRTLVHGAPQRDLATALGVPNLRHVQLPVGTFLRPAPRAESSPSKRHALCLGEIRANKGVDLAIRAAVLGNVDLRVLGRIESPELRANLRRLAAGTSNVHLEDRFLTRGEFESAMVDAAVIVLPYTHFDAQSGVLARAMSLGKPVLASNLSSLRDQAKGYPRIRFVDTQSSMLLSRALREMLEASASASATESSSAEAYNGWETVTSEILDGWRLP